MGQESCEAVLKRLQFNGVKSGSNLTWLQEQMHPYFFITNADQPDALASLTANLHRLETEQRLVLTEREDLLMQAQLAAKGSIYAALRASPERDISYLQFNRSYAPLPWSEKKLEVLRFAYARKTEEEIAGAPAPQIPPEIWNAVLEVFANTYAEVEADSCARLLQLLWLNNETYVRISPPERVARLLWLYSQTLAHADFHLAVEQTEGFDGSIETRVLFGIGNPPQRGFLPQVLEIFNRLNLRIKRAYGIKLSNGVHPYFLATYYVENAGEGLLEQGSPLFNTLQEELYNTQLLPGSSQTYRKLLQAGLCGGSDATLIRAMIGFCHTNLAHNHPDSFDLEGVMRAFHNHPELSLQLVKLFRTRFDPLLEGREERYREVLAESERTIDNFNSGRRFLDQYRRTVFRCALAFIRHCLKTNFFVAEKHALAFRLDPAYLEDLGDDFTNDLPAERPFRITYFFGRFGAAYHIGFSDIARGGWRTLITGGRDDYVTCANTLLRETYVLAHTQHLKNKDIYEGGSKLVAVLNAGGEEDPERRTQMLHKLQYGFCNAFLDLFVTENGIARDPRVVDYYRDDEPIELGPDENMHDCMVERIAARAKERNYLLGVGIMSSKQVGINHKEFGVTSTGVVRFAEITLQQLGIDPAADPFSVKLTGGPNGDVAGNALRLLLQRCPQVRIKLIIDGTAALCDPAGADHEALSAIVLQQDLEAFDPEALSPGAFLLYRQQVRWEGMRKLYRKLERKAEALVETWVSSDEFYRVYDRLLFEVPADLFIPAGGRPETIDADNWQGFLDVDGQPNTRAIVEGANSFITPPARIELQRAGVILMRDCSANKCGVISSSYEIIANLLMSDAEFLEHKTEYVADVLRILTRRAEDEANLIFRRHEEAQGTFLYTELSDGISREINGYYAELFAYFQRHPERAEEPLYREALERHLPDFITRSPVFCRHIDQLPAKIRHAILASEIASSLVYHGGQRETLIDQVETYLKRRRPAA